MIVSAARAPCEETATPVRPPRPSRDNALSMEPIELVISAALRARFPIVSCGAFLVKGLDGFDATPLLLAPETLRSRLESTGLTPEGIPRRPENRRLAQSAADFGTQGLEVSQQRRTTRSPDAAGGCAHAVVTSGPSLLSDLRDARRAARSVRRSLASRPHDRAALRAAGRLVRASRSIL